jgi:hypothetical protein
MKILETLGQFFDKSNMQAVFQEAMKVLIEFKPLLDQDIVVSEAKKKELGFLCACNKVIFKVASMVNLHKIDFDNFKELIDFHYLLVMEKESFFKAYQTLWVEGEDSDDL